MGDVRRYSEGLISNLTKLTKNGMKLNILVQNSTERMVKIFSELIGAISDLFGTYFGTPKIGFGVYFNIKLKL